MNTQESLHPPSVLVPQLAQRISTRSRSAWCTPLALSFATLLVSTATQADSTLPSANTAPSSSERAASLDAKLGQKGWNMHVTSFADTLTQDDGEWRTRLAEKGFGLSVQVGGMGQANILNRPRRVPDTAPACPAEGLKYNCAGGKSYYGQKGDYFYLVNAYLTYDTSRWGVPDGQIAVGGHAAKSSDGSFTPTTAVISQLTWYQTMLDRKLELKVGYLPALVEYMGTFVGGQVTSPFGPSGFIPALLGLTPNNASTPSLRLKWNMTPNAYLQVGAARSFPVRGPTGVPLYDELETNSTGLRFKSAIPGTRMLYISELGYRREAQSGTPHLWVRGGYLHNTSDFTDYSRMLEDPNATRKGASGMFLLADRQVWQQAPQSPYTAYRGIYVGGSFMKGEERSLSFSKYYELRAFWLGPTDSRPADMISVIASRNYVGKHLRNVINAGTPMTGLSGIGTSNNVTVSYMARLRPGFYATVGLGYTDRPSIMRFKGMGDSLSVLTSINGFF